MKKYSVSQFKSIDLKTLLERLMLLSLFVVWVVWPLRGTIAARNIALVLGALASIAWLNTERPKFALSELLPIGLLLLVPAWLLGLYIFNPVVPNLQWDELRGTWLRMVIAIIFAIGLGKLYLNRHHTRRFFLWILFIWPVVILLIFISQGVFTHSWFGEQIYIYVLKSKIAGVYFLIWPLILCFSVFHLYIRNENSVSNLPSATIISILFSICLVDYFLLKSLNSFVCIFLSILFLAYIFSTTKNKDITKSYLFWKMILSGTFILSLVAAIFFMDATLYGSKLINFFSDMNFTVNLDNTGAWRCGGTGTRECFGSYSGPYPPINVEMGISVNGSTYERLAWAREGLTFLRLNPFGLGYTVDALSYYMSDKYVGSDVTKTHSGWLDFALGAGYVGLISVWLAMGIIFLRARMYMKNLKNAYEISIYVCWSIALLALLWAIAELSDREYIEHFFFMVTFFSIAITSQKNHS